MQNTVTYACTALKGTNKQGVLTPDQDGYYDMVLGALDFYNSAGAFYPFAPAKQIFEESSSLMRRIKDGALRGEMGHPKKTPGMGMRDYISRILEIHEENVCCHIKEVRIEQNSVKDKKGRPVIATLGKIKPSGPKGDALKAALENPNENVCFSIRSLTRDINVGGVVHKHLKTVVTWDYVNEPGIDIAKRWHAPGLEAMDLDEEFQIAEQSLIALKEKRDLEGISMESSGGVSVDQVMDDLGFNDKPIPTKPISSRW